MGNAPAVRTGIVLAVVVGIGYSSCALVFRLWPEAAATFMNGLFHGLDFRKLQSGPSLFSFGSFLYALVGIMTWAFALGALYFRAPRTASDGRRERPCDELTA